MFIACNLVYDHFGGWGWVYYFGQALAFVAYSLALYLLRRNTLTEGLLVLTTGQFFDEVIGDPTRADPIEYIIIGTYLLYLLGKWLLSK